MVPIEDEKFLLASGSTSIDTMVSADPTVAEAGLLPSHFQEQLVCIRGKSAGETQIVFRSAARQEIGRLDVRVFPRISRSVKFFLVKDQAGHWTIRDERQVRKWVETTNELILGPQANVYFRVKSVEPLPVKGNRGAIIHFEPFNISVPKTASHKNWHDITARGDPDPKVFNVFCVWDFYGGSHWDAFVAARSPVDASKMALSGANVNMCIIKDQTSTSAAGVFAHEAVHYLSRLIGVDHSSQDHRLMRDEGQGIPGRFLSRAEIEGIHKWAAKA
jgi:hypothetical protein